MLCVKSSASLISRRWRDRTNSEGPCVVSLVSSPLVPLYHKDKWHLPFVRNALCWALLISLSGVSVLLTAQTEQSQGSAGSVRMGLDAGKCYPTDAVLYLPAF